MKFVGIDGCSKGWFAVLILNERDWSIGIFPDIKSLWEAHQDSTLILIDIPIGLPYLINRVCDGEARRILGKRGSSVFPAPARKAIHARNYEAACQINQKILGKKISLQTWHISHKIWEVDDLLIRDRNARNCFRESHPEICFWALAGGEAMSYSKKTAPGISERLAVLSKRFPGSEDIFRSASGEFKRRDLAIDDILDAMVLAITASSSPENLKTIPEFPDRDREHLPMEIVYSNRYR